MEGKGEGKIHLYGSHPYLELPSYPSPISRSPISALNNFLLSQIDNTKGMMLMGNELGKLSNPFSFAGSSISRSHASGSYPQVQLKAFSSQWLLLMLQDQSNNNYFNFNDHYFGQGRGFFQSRSIDFNQDPNHHHLMMSPDLDWSMPVRGKNASSFLIRGQWTEEEDSALTELVDTLGKRKWSHISNYLIGRTGKQCRERWKNHLRRDIKKDLWTEEEEKILVRSHQLFGNKWAEIAKKIPGRTENSIKNHWNATKRRHNSKTNNKKIDGRTGKQNSGVLQEYVKKIWLSAYPKEEDLSDIDVPSPLLDDVCDDEIAFMQNFFKDFNTCPPVPQVVEYDEHVSLSSNKTDKYRPIDKTVEGGFSWDYENLIDLTRDIMVVDYDANVEVAGPLSSDLYISQLLEGVDCNFSSSSTLLSVNGDNNNSYDEVNEGDMEMEMNIIYQEGEDMDLMEMVHDTSPCLGD